MQYCCVVDYFCLLLKATSFSVEGFTENPSLAILSTVKKTELVLLATHYKLKVISSAKKVDIRRILTHYLVDKEIVSEEEEESLPDLELRKLEYQE